MTKWSECKKGGWSKSFCSIFIAALPHETGLPNKYISYRIFKLGLIFSCLKLQSDASIVNSSFFDFHFLFSVSVYVYLSLSLSVCFSLTHPSSVSVINIESLQNRLLKVCYVPATSAGLSRLLFLFCGGH
jgi:hypothetical protein